MRDLRATRATSLEDAQVAKLDAICRKLDLHADDHLLEIGTGWGALAIHAAAHYGCRVTTTTISREQHALASERVRAAGLEDRVTVLLQDYRELEGTYDKLVSVEMIEAVGWRNFDRFFAALQRAARARRADARCRRSRSTTAPTTSRRPARRFITTFIFPGGCAAVDRGDGALRAPAHRPAVARPRGHHRALRRSRCATGASGSRRRPTSSTRSATTCASAASGSSTSLLRGGLRRAADRRRAGRSSAKPRRSAARAAA